MKMYGCRLPWMNILEFKNDSGLCIGNEANGTFNELLDHWDKMLLEVIQDCPSLQKCKKTIYDVNFAPLSKSPGTKKSIIKMQLASTSVQFIEDTIAYDLQSLIGEVGGTLGLLLGLSFVSVFELIEYLISRF